MVCFKLFYERVQETEKQVHQLVFEPDTFRKQVWTSPLNLPAGSCERCGVGMHINLCSVLWCSLYFCASYACVEKGYLLKLVSRR